ncbi:multiubiquitin domain-containing protein [Sphingomonas aerolata]|uniref:multiubiquitin domain-containing protein n=1 Tax=Sphingomonas aerolata TaxID=185951 RepID=UPI003344436B
MSPFTRSTYRINNQTLPISDALMTGRQIRTEGGFDPASEYVLIVVEDRGTRSIGLDEKVALDPAGSTEFHVFESDRVYSFTLDERGYEWGGERIAVEDLRRFAHISDDRELVLDGDHDEVLAPGSTLDLSKRGAERIRSRRVQPKNVTIIVNGREKSVPRGLISYERIVELAFGTEAPAVTHTVNWRLRDGDEGSLVVGQTVEVRQGMIFTATATNRS